MIKRLLIVIIVAGAFSCGGSGSDSDDPCADLNLRVYGGEQCRYERSPVVAIVGFDADFNPVGVCTATMVTVNDALTAAHCAVLTQYPGGAAVFADDEFHLITRGVNHPYYNGQVGSPYDAAMITIGSILDIGPVPLQLSDSLAIGETITGFGYGKNEESVSAPRAADFRAARLGINYIDAYNFVAGVEDEGKSLCFGDSGGPATQTVNGVTGVVGITSFGPEGCDSYSAFVNVQNPEIYNFILDYAADVAIM
jgi:hypothetical protein